MGEWLSMRRLTIGTPGSLSWGDAEYGDFFWQVYDDGMRVIWLLLPRVGLINLLTTPTPKGLRPGVPIWEWDGNEDHPTLQPSVYSRGNGGSWHGFITAGRLEEC